MFGPKLAEECEAWARAFALEPKLIESAIESLLELMNESGASDAARTQEMIAKTLSDLRKEVKKSMSNEADALTRVKHLEAIAIRLDRTIENAGVLEQSGVSRTVSSLRPRLLAARAMVGAIRAALARRPKRR